MRVPVSVPVKNQLEAARPAPTAAAVRRLEVAALLEFGQVAAGLALRPPQEFRELAPRYELDPSVIPRE
jgi:hypothetical protein